MQYLGSFSGMYRECLGLCRNIPWSSKIFTFKMAERSHFVAPVIEDNPNGWGPTSVSDAFKGIPYQPFSKADRLGKVGQSLRLVCCD